MQFNFTYILSPTKRERKQEKFSGKIQKKKRKKGEDPRIAINIHQRQIKVAHLRCKTHKRSPN